MNHCQTQPLNGSLPLPIFSVMPSDQVRFLAEDEKHKFVFFQVLLPSRCSSVSHLCTLAFKCSFFPFFPLCFTCFSLFFFFACFSCLFSSPSLSLTFDSLCLVIMKAEQSYVIATFTPIVAIFAAVLCFISFFVILKERFQVLFATKYVC